MNLIKIQTVAINSRPENNSKPCYVNSDVVLINTDTITRIVDRNDGAFSIYQFGHNYTIHILESELSKLYTDPKDVVYTPRSAMLRK